MIDEGEIQQLLAHQQRRWLTTYARLNDLPKYHPDREQTEQTLWFVGGIILGLRYVLTSDADRRLV